MRKLYSTVIFLSIFSACTNDYREKYIVLEKKYADLKTENDKIKSQINTLSFWPVAISKSNTIKLGETYMVNIRLAIVDTVSPPSVKFDMSKELGGDFNNHYDDFYQCSILEIKSNKRGVFEIPGKIHFDLLGKKIESEFSISYNVK